MKIIILKIGIVFINIIYFFIKLLPIRNKIVFISRQSNTKTEDMLLIEEELKKQDKDVKIVFLCKKLEGGTKAIGYVFHMFRQMYHLATSRVVVLDSYCIVASILKKKKGTTIIQMWHALGSFKKFGYSVLDQEEGSSSKLAKVMKMHHNYDYIFTSSEFSSKYFAEAFNADKSKMVVMPLARVDLLTSKKLDKELQAKIYKKYPETKTKKNIVYVPTFRKDGERPEKIKELIDAVDYKKYNLILKLHPLTKIDFGDIKAIYDKDFSSIEMLSVADYVISDYSAIIYEASLKNKPMYFYCYDYDSYFKKRNFYLDYNKDIPGLKEQDAKKLVKAIEKDKYDFKELKKFNDKFISYEDGKCSYNIAKFILSKMSK